MTARMTQPDLLGVLMLLGLAVWVTRAVFALHEHGPIVWHVSRVIRS